MSKNQQINIRFDPETDAALEKTADKLGCSKSALVRRLTEAFLEEVAATGVVALAPEWLARIRKADGRTKWGGGRGGDGSDNRRGGGVVRDGGERPGRNGGTDATDQTAARKAWRTG